jgi:hypothetical protein
MFGSLQSLVSKTPSILNEWIDSKVMTIAGLARCTFGKNIVIPPYLTYFSKEYIYMQLLYFPLVYKTFKIFMLTLQMTHLHFKIGFHDEKLPFPFGELHFGEEIIKYVPDICSFHVLDSCCTHHICGFQNIWRFPKWQTAWQNSSTLYFSSIF